MEVCFSFSRVSFLDVLVFIEKNVIYKACLRNRLTVLKCCKIRSESVPGHKCFVFTPGQQTADVVIPGFQVLHPDLE